MSEDMPKQWQAGLDELPEPLKAELMHSLQRIEEALSDPERQQLLDTLTQQPELAAGLIKAWACSESLVQACVVHPQWMLAGLGGDWCVRLSGAQQVEGIRAQFHELLDEPDLTRRLRLCRHQQMMRIIFRDLSQRANLQETLLNLSTLAEQCLQISLDWHYDALCTQLGEPIGAHSGKPQQLVVIAMGKLGAVELNLSSDIDLMFAYPEAGHTVAGPRSLANAEFFLRLGQRLIKSLHAVTEDGFVFRVDMRLRPYGESGSLALSFDAMEEYYQDQGRDWERYAMVKARAVAGDLVEGERLLQALRPFTYRRYIDFSAIDSLRDMKAMIARHHRAGLENLKTGSGGIREVEFIAQVFQLIRGGREPRLQHRSVQIILQTLAELGLMPKDSTEELVDAYIFLRRSEHALQAVQDKQTQSLPADLVGQSRQAFALGFAQWADYLAVLDQHRDRVKAHFRNVVASPKPSYISTRVGEDHQPWAALWLQELTQEQALEQMQNAGFESPQGIIDRLHELFHSRRLQSMQTLGRDRLDHFMPTLLHALSQRDRNASITLARLLPFVEAIVRRSAYMTLLVENQGALNQLVILCEASPWIAQQLALHPVLLDELLDVNSLYSALEPAQLRRALQQQLLNYAADDLEAHMDALRYFKLSHVLRVAAAEVSAALPIMKVSDYLSYIAEVTVAQVLSLAWQQLSRKYGVPRTETGAPSEVGFTVVAYGKLGGVELGYSSDLDLVFLHDGAANQTTDGAQSIDNNVFYTRLGQRIIHIITTHTTLGKLYDVDMRLRPSGNSGLLVTSFAGFAKYQQDSAWTWEHQALVRARPIAGCYELSQAFEKLRARLLSQPRDLQRLREQVVEMREKMYQHLVADQAKAPTALIFDLKQSRGGIVDIEFMVQYAVLAWAPQSPDLLQWTDNIRILESLRQANHISDADAGVLTQAYKAYRAKAHLLALQQLPAEVLIGEVQHHQQAVRACWQRLLGEVN